MYKKWMILMCTFSAITMAFSIVCFGLIYYSETVRTELNSNKILANNNIYKKISIIYEQSNSVKLSSITPGYSVTQKFSISNDNSNTIKYDIVWENVTSTWDVASSSEIGAHPEELVYSINCSNGEKIENKVMPTSNENPVILENLELKTNKSNICTITISFVSKGIDQSYNFNKSFGGTYKVLIKE